MLKGKSITLRPVLDTDIEKLYEYHTDIQNRGDYYPRAFCHSPPSKSSFKKMASGARMKVC
jgi:hypothetical protein